MIEIKEEVSLKTKISNWLKENPTEWEDMVDEYMCYPNSKLRYKRCAKHYRHYIYSIDAAGEFQTLVKYETLNKIQSLIEEIFDEARSNVIKYFSRPDRRSAEAIIKFVHKSPENWAMNYVEDVFQDWAEGPVGPTGSTLYTLALGVLKEILDTGELPQL